MGIEKGNVSYIRARLVGCEVTGDSQLDQLLQQHAFREIEVASDYTSAIGFCHPFNVDLPPRVHRDGKWLVLGVRWDVLKVPGEVLKRRVATRVAKWRQETRINKCPKSMLERFRLEATKELRPRTLPRTVMAQVCILDDGTIRAFGPRSACVAALDLMERRLQLRTQTVTAAVRAFDLIGTQLHSLEPERFHLIRQEG